MQDFSKILGAIGGVASPTGGILGALSPIMSIFGAINQFSLAQKEKQAMDRSLYYSKHPEAINALVKGFERPLSTGLTSGVGNIVNASLAEQGLSQAPGIQSQVLAQALAPYQQNEQQMAISEAMKAIGLPAEALAGIQSTIRPDQLSLMLKSILPGGGGGGWSGGAVGNTPDNALSGIAYMPQPGEGVYGPDLAPPFDPSQLFAGQGKT